MKKTLFILSLLTTTVLSVNAQIPVVSKALPSPMFGIKLDENFNQLSSSGSVSNAYNGAFMPGIFGGLRKGSFGLRVEVLLNFSKYDFSIPSSVSGAGTSVGQFKNYYLDIPVLIEYKLISRIWAQGGIQFSRTLSVSSSNTLPNSTSPKDYFQDNNYSGVLGLEVRLPIHLVFGARYVLGFVNLNKVPAGSDAKDSWMARTAQIYAGFRFI